MQDEPRWQHMVQVGRKYVLGSLVRSNYYYSALHVMHAASYAESAELVLGALKKRSPASIILWYGLRPILLELPNTTKWVPANIFGGDLVFLFVNIDAILN